jgi:hypothetical protein
MQDLYSRMRGVIYFLLFSFMCPPFSLICVNREKMDKIRPGQTKWAGPLCEPPLETYLGRTWDFASNGSKWTLLMFKLV